ncbi:MAG TPA: molybdopterin cofactor-binding domain-containing protein, partial [Candidatus Limnocylindrales bacterium]|nr:molybdopterin cofactor-binding domain-containing protein [Candidatus Limnocylindrales bacterium]
MPGVRAIVAGSDARPVRFGRRLQDWPVLGWDRVRFVGDRVAAAAADSDAAAAAAIEAIVVEYEDLPAILDPEAALAPNATLLHPDASDYRYLGPARPPVSHPNVQGEALVTRGLAADDDPDGFERLFTGAAQTFSHEFTAGRQHQGYLEPHVALVEVGEDDRIQVATTNKAPFSLRGQMAAALGLASESIVVDSSVIGGDFGGKGLSVDEYICLLLSRAARRPVRLVAGYDEELQAYAPRHGARLRLRTAVLPDGRIVAHDADVLFDGGAYAAAKPIPQLIPPGGLDVMAPYDVPHVRIRVRSVYTNTVPGGHMRCPGELQAAFATESHMDLMARALGLDPLEFRLRNAVHDGSTSAAGERIRAPMAVAVLERLAAERRAAEGPGQHITGTGFGVGLVARRMEGGRETILAGLTPDGRVRLVTGLPDQGAGAYTAIARIAAAALGIDPAGVEVDHLTTAVASPDLGVGASRVTYIAGRAAERAALALAQRLEGQATAMAGCDLCLRDGVFVSEDGTVRLDFPEVAAAASAAGLAAEGVFDSHAEDVTGEADFTFAGLGATVSVDTDTGRVRLEDAVLVADTGTVINPLAHEGQIEGGFAQGLGAALMEELIIDAGQVRTANLSDYQIPASTDVPQLRTVVLTEGSGPGAFGAKMAGELSPSCVAPAIANAIADAVGVRLERLPMTPESLLRGLRDR